MVTWWLEEEGLSHLEGKWKPATSFRVQPNPIREGEVLAVAVHLVTCIIIRLVLGVRGGGVTLQAHHARRSEGARQLSSPHLQGGFSGYVILTSRRVGTKIGIVYSWHMPA